MVAAQSASALGPQGSAVPRRPGRVVRGRPARPSVMVTSWPLKPNPRRWLFPSSRPATFAAGGAARRRGSARGSARLPVIGDRTVGHRADPQAAGIQVQGRSGWMGSGTIPRAACLTGRRGTAARAQRAVPVTGPRLRRPSPYSPQRHGPPSARRLPRTTLLEGRRDGGVGSPSRGGAVDVLTRDTAPASAPLLSEKS